MPSSQRKLSRLKPPFFWAPNQAVLQTKHSCIISFCSCVLCLPGRRSYVIGESLTCRCFKRTLAFTDHIIHVIRIIHRSHIIHMTPSTSSTPSAPSIVLIQSHPHQCSLAGAWDVFLHLGVLLSAPDHRQSCPDLFTARFAGCPGI